MHAARANRRQQRAGIIGQQKNGREIRRLFQNLQQRVSRFFHEVGVAEDVHPLATFNRTEIDFVDHVPHLVDFHQHLRRVGRNDHHVRMSLHEDARFLFVGLAQILPRLDSFGKAIFQRIGSGNTNAVAAMAAEVW